MSIFLSLLDVHMNRSPYGGRVVDVTTRPGRFLAAYRAESAMKNERSEIIVEQVVGGHTAGSSTASSSDSSPAASSPASSRATRSRPASGWA